MIEYENVCNGVIDCIDRSDESGCKLYSSTFNYDIFHKCIVDETNNHINHTEIGSFGFQCTHDICLDWDIWCNREKQGKLKSDHVISVKCPHLLDQINNQLLCSNFSFWQSKKCNLGLKRCMGNFPGQCVSELEIDYDDDIFSIPKCADKSDFILTRDCDDEDLNKIVINCTVSDVSSFCIHKDLQCDGHLNCPDGSDEDEAICGNCPRPFGHPTGNSKHATMSCQHRYTNRSICAVPCDGKDDLCADFLDEKNCKISTVEYTILFLALLLCFAIVVGEITFWFEKKSEEYCKKEDKDTAKLEIFDTNIRGKKYDCCKIKGYTNTTELVNNPTLQGKLIKYFYQLELKFHNNNECNAYICLKNNLETNETVHIFLKYIGHESYFSR